MQLCPAVAAILYKRDGVALTTVILIDQRHDGRESGRRCRCSPVPKKRTIQWTRTVGGVTDLLGIPSKSSALVGRCGKEGDSGNVTMVVARGIPFGNDSLCRNWLGVTMELARATTNKFSKDETDWVTQTV